QVAGVEGPGRQLAGGGDREFDAALMGLGGLADHQGGDEGLVERTDEGVRQPLRLLLVADGEVECLLSAPEFDERRDRVQWLACSCVCARSASDSVVIVASSPVSSWMSVRSRRVATVPPRPELRPESRPLPRGWLACFWLMTSTRS